MLWIGLIILPFDGSRNAPTTVSLQFVNQLDTASSDLSKTKVGLEATGHYSYNLLGFLLDNGLTTYVLNPLHTNLYRTKKPVRLIFALEKSRLLICLLHNLFPNIFLRFPIGGLFALLIFIR